MEHLVSKIEQVKKVGPVAHPKPRLINSSKGLELAADLRCAKSFYARGKGLLGRSNLPMGEGLWIWRCTSIHTFFMRFAIDVVFVDENLIVKVIFQNVQPWRMTMPAWTSSSVFELPAGTLARCPTEVGDQMYVGA